MLPPVLQTPLSMKGLTDIIITSFIDSGVCKQYEPRKERYTMGTVLWLSPEELLVLQLYALQADIKRAAGEEKKRLQSEHIKQLKHLHSVGGLTDMSL